MPRIRFFVVNALACLSWTTLTASIAYAAGPTGAIILVAAGIALSVGVLLARMVRRRARRHAGAPARAPLS